MEEPDGAQVVEAEPHAEAGRHQGLDGGLAVTADRYRMLRSRGVYCSPGRFVKFDGVIRESLLTVTVCWGAEVCIVHREGLSSLPALRDTVFFAIDEKLTGRESTLHRSFQFIQKDRLLPEQ